MQLLVEPDADVEGKRQLQVAARGVPASPAADMDMTGSLQNGSKLVNALRF